jgi:catechol 2,3-dioxygenase-like lactoylglutathione lyase family enzyme
MNRSITTLLDLYDRRAIGRRQLVSGLAAVCGIAATAEAREFEPKNIDHVSVVASHPRKSAEFYRDTFGLTIIGEPAADGAIRLGIDRQLRLTLRPGERPGVIDHFSFGVAPFDERALTRVLGDRGVATYTEPPAFGFHVKDPDGVAVQLSNAR